MQKQNGCPAAVARIHGDEAHPGICGRVSFFPCADGTMVAARIAGLPKSETGFFAFHIHEGTDCRGDGFPNTGSHYNPWDVSHPSHAGDLPPLLSCEGRAEMSVWTGRFRVQEVIGRTVVIHSHPDDFKTQPSGAAGSKIACGVIRKV